MSRVPGGIGWVVMNTPSSRRIRSQAASLAA
jgi:hypothetical protein